MRLKYKILWFEDIDSWIEGKIKHVKDIVEEHGFQWIKPIIYDKDNFDGDYNSFDMILMDYSLIDGKVAGKTGADIIKKIRENESYTNIMFYSQSGASEIRKEIADKQLDGVFCADRDDFIEEFENVFEMSIRKIEDVNNLRGLVMAETADLESLKEEIIELYDSIECPKKEKIVEKTLSELNEANGKRAEFIKSKTKSTPFIELLDIFDFYKKSLTLHRINARESPLCEFKHEDFNKEIIKKRNLLAHVQETEITVDAVKQIILKSEKNGDELIFSPEEAKRIRKDIMKYKQEFDKLKEELARVK